MAGVTGAVRGSNSRNLVFRREFGLAVLIGAVSLTVGVVDPGFLSAGVWRDIVVRCAPTAIVACGVMLVVVSGEIDISVGSLMALLAVVLGLLTSPDKLQVSLWIGIPAVLGLGTLTGFFTGALVTWGRVPSIIVTLGLLTALRGLTTLLLGGRNITRLPESLSQAARQGVLGLPVSVWTAACVIPVTAILISRTPLGRRLYALGSSPGSAEMAGLSARRLRLFVFTWTGFLTAVATVVEVPRLPQIESGLGQDLELLVITCVVVGGVSVSGGRGRLAGVLLAVLLMAIIRPVLTFLDVGEAAEKWTKAVQGVFIMVAVTGDQLVSRYRRRGQVRCRDEN